MWRIGSAFASVLDEVEVDGTRALHEELDGFGSGSGPIASSCSPAIRSGSRLVATTWMRGAARSSSDSGAAATSTCSRLSSTSRKGACHAARPPACRAGVSPGRSRSSSVCEIVEMTASVSSAPASATKKTPLGKRSCIFVASSIASRVLPIPPGPVSVSTRRSRARRSSAASASSASRPTSGDGGVGILLGRGSNAASVAICRRARPMLRGVAAEATSPPLEQREPRGEALELPLVTPLLELAAANQPPRRASLLSRRLVTASASLARHQARFHLFGELRADDPALVAHPEHRGGEERDM